MIKRIEPGATTDEIRHLMVMVDVNGARMALFLSLSSRHGSLMSSVFWESLALRGTPRNVGTGRGASMGRRPPGDGKISPNEFEKMLKQGREVTRVVRGSATVQGVSLDEVGAQSARPPAAMLLG